MVIYKTNLAEKLFGYAISRDFIKYSSPFCDMIDDPELAVDFDLAINFNQGLAGNKESKRNFTETLVLSSSKIDPGTFEFWRDKMYQYPEFDSEVEYVKFTFYALDDLAGSSGSDSFANRLKNALKDCLNSPCNPFAQSSDSMGILSQVETAMTDKTIFPIGSLADSFKMVTTGIDKSVFNKIPELFQGAITQIGEMTTKTWKTALEAMTNKIPQSELINLARGGSLRSENLGLPYTPDLKSLFDINAAAENILAGVAQDLGGCFDKFQHNVRYNPYSSNQNQATPADIRGNNVNGVPYDQLPTGQALGPTPPSSNDTLGVPKETISKNDGKSPPVTDIPTLDPASRNWDGKPVTTTPITLQFNGRFRYSVFGAWLDAGKKTILVDDVDGPNGNPQIMGGTSNIGDIVTPSRSGHPDAVLIQKALEKKEYPAGACAGYATLHAQGEKTNTDLSSISGKFNHGCSLSLDLINQLLGPQSTLTYSKAKQLQQNKKIFGVFTHKGKTTTMQILNITDGTKLPGVALTPYAFFKATGTTPGMKKDTANSNTEKVKYGSWQQVKYKAAPNVGDILFKIVIK